MKTKSILITGAASGVGLATAKKFADKGWQLGLIDLNHARLEQLHKELGMQHWFKAVDVCDEAAVKSAVDEFAQRSGNKIDVLFNCAGVLEMGDFEAISLERQHRIFDINVKGLISLSYHCLPYLKHAKGALVLNMSSASAVQGVPYFAAYSASKFAVRGLTEALNIELKEHGIAVKDIMAPFVSTPMVNNQMNRPPVVKRLGVSLSAEDVADTAWKVSQQKGNQVHNPISKFLKGSMLINKLVPYRMSHTVMSLLSK